jgi:hypothetical protein
MLFLVLISFSSVRRSTFQKFSDFSSFGGSKPNRRMIKAKTIEIVLMASGQREKMIKARMPSRTPSNGLETANQREASQPAV